MEHIVLTIKEFALSDPLQKELISKLQLIDNDQIIAEVVKEDDIFGSPLVVEIEHNHNNIIVYLYENEDVLFASEF